ncbi:MAG: PilZ domain-containing protein [Myxococcales bacterium]|nr:PilZ domain-containing protein [Myxococcales bacterium]
MRDSEIQVKTGIVTSSSAETVGIQLFDPIEAPIKNVTGKLVTLIYGANEQIYRLKSRIAQVSSANDIIVEVVGEAKKRERREFLRVEAKLPTKLYPLVSEDDDAALIEAEKLDTTSAQFEERNVNLSGSGIRFFAPDGEAHSNYYLVQMVLPFRPDTPVSTVGRVARIDDLPDGSTAVAIHFVNVSVRAQDMIINFVFKRQYELIEEKFKEN